MKISAITLLLSSLLSAAIATAEDAAFSVLAYHDVKDLVSDDFDRDQYAISTRNLIDHFTWLQVHEFVPVSIDDILLARAGGVSLPDKAVLLTFDDGFRSAYTHVLPLLKLFDYPAVISVVTNWIENDAVVQQGGRTLTRDDFLTWAQLGALQASGLVEIASHSHNLHRGVLANPQGNEQPAAVSIQYSASGYEDRPSYYSRINNDLATSAQLIEQHTGRVPRVVTWPFGAYNDELLAAAAGNGMTIGLTLEDGPNTLDSLDRVTRHLVEANPGIEALGFALLHPTPERLVRAAQVDLDYVYAEDEAEQERNLSALLERIKTLQISHVFLQAFADPDADGGAQALYFPNDYLPMRADLFNRVAWQLKTRSNVLVYAWLPLLSFEGSAIDSDWYVMQSRSGEISRDAHSEPRLSPFEPAATDVIKGIYRSLAMHASFDGLLFHDDGRFNEFEDVNPAAIEAYRSEFGEQFSLDTINANAELKQDWSRFKSRRLIEFSQELSAIVRQYRPAIKTTRNLFAPALLDPNARHYLAQDYDDFLAAYDHVTLMAMPYFEGNANPRAFYRRLAEVVATRPKGLARTIFELQTVDWRNDLRIPTRELYDTMRRLQSMGVRHLAYYPDDFVLGYPELSELRRGISLADFPSGEQP